jgi:diaminopimelate epimerase
MQLNFVKMEGLGNDFMVVEWPADARPVSTQQVVRWADRRFGVGFDSLLLVDRGQQQGGVAASYRVLNADGSEAEQCGNGARCIARYLAEGRPADMTLASLGGVIAAQVLASGSVRVNLGEPDFRPAALPFAATGDGPDYHLSLPSGDISFQVCSMGNPHAVTAVNAVDLAAVANVGATLGAHPSFPKGVNVGFVQRIDSTHLRLRVHERGIGETRACGTGAAAAMAVGRRFGDLDETVEVQLPGGVLTVSWPGPGTDLWQTGPATTVYEGTIDL